MYIGKLIESDGTKTYKINNTLKKIVLPNDDSIMDDIRVKENSIIIYIYNVSVPDYSLIRKYFRFQK